MVPVVVYLLSYIPYFTSGASFRTWDDIVRHQSSMYLYHSRLTAKDPFASRFFSWPFLNRPHWLYVMNAANESIKGSIVVIGNPAIWWAILPTTGAMLYFSRFRSHPSVTFCLLAFASLYVPWIFIGRITYLYHFHPAFSFALLLIAFLWADLWKKSKTAAGAYLGLVLGLFVWFWPVLCGREVSPSYIYSLRWFATWIF